MQFITREEKLRSNYRRVEAMYRRDCTIDEIVRSTGLTLMDVLDITQKIFALDIQKKLR